MTDRSRNILFDTTMLAVGSLCAAHVKVRWRQALALHDTHDTPCTRKQEIDHCITLFAEAVELCFLFNAKVLCDASEQVDGDELAKARKEDDVVGEKQEVTPALGVAGILGVRCGHPV
jgi:hypothetical protein